MLMSTAIIYSIKRVYPVREARAQEMEQEVARPMKEELVPQGEEAVAAEVVRVVQVLDRQPPPPPLQLPQPPLPPLQLLVGYRIQWTLPTANNFGTQHNFATS